MALYDVIHDQKLIIVQQELKLGAKDTTIEMQGRVFRATEKELKKQMRKEKRKSFVKGAATGAGAAVLIWFAIKT